MIAMTNVFVLLTATLLVCSVPALVVAQRRDRIDVTRRFVRGAILVGVGAAIATLFFDRLGSRFVGLMVTLVVLYTAAGLVAALVMSRSAST